MPISNVQSVVTGYGRSTLQPLPQNLVKALKLWHQSVQLGCTLEYCNIANACYNGEGVERDEKKSKHYFELAAIGGDAVQDTILASMSWMQAI